MSFAFNHIAWEMIGRLEEGVNIVRKLGVFISEWEMICTF